MAMAIQVNGLTMIPPEILEMYKENCPLERFTIGCLRKQLLAKKVINASALIVLNKQIIRNEETEIMEKDLVEILPLVAGG